MSKQRITQPLQRATSSKSLQFPSGNFPSNWMHLNQVRWTTFVLTTLTVATIIGSIDVNIPQFIKTFDAQLNNKPRFVGGNKAEPNQYPWVISMQGKTEKGWTHQCGGAIIHEKLIVTAGHCVINKTASDITVVAGAHNIAKDEPSQQRRQVQEIVSHPNYSSNGGPAPFDVAILRLQESLVLNENVAKGKLAECGEEPEVGQGCVYTGWGNTMPFSPVYYKGSDELLVESGSIISLENCEKSYPTLKNALTTDICSKSEVFHGTCQGDSGGPLACGRNEGTEQYLAGVVSFGFPVCNDGYHPDVYTSLGNPLVCEFLKDSEKLDE